MSKIIGVVGLGYVGLPLAIELAKHFDVIGFDVNEKRIQELNHYNDRNGETSTEDLEQTTIDFSTSSLTGSRIERQMYECDVIIVAVPTPVDKNNVPDFTPMIGATEMVASMLPQEGCTIVYESTVYPGATEEICVPILEKFGKVWKKDFNVGYSPERINPGDKVHTLTNIVKVVAGDTPETTDMLAELYGTIITAGIHKAPSIAVAEAAKVIENTQRDINIAFMNELQMIFDKMDISTKDVLEAARTKWNFLPYEPGLVGGHCIGVDPYYLAYKAEEYGYNPEIIKAGRRINDRMGEYHATQFVKKAIVTGLEIQNLCILVLGITFKENCPDIRNTKVIDLIHSLISFGIKVDVYDPVADPKEVWDQFGIKLVDSTRDEAYPAMLLAVKHDKILERVKNGSIAVVEPEFIYNIKNM